MKLRTIPAVAALVTAAALTLGLATAAPTGAHEGSGVIAVDQAHPTGQSVHYVVLVTWADDGHPAVDATVTATPIGPDGTQETPVELTPSASGEGRYEGTVELPAAGAWTVRFTSIDPTGSFDHAQEIAAPTTTTPAPTDTSAGESDAPSTTATTAAGAAPAGDDTSAGAQGAPASDGDDDGSIPVLLIVGAVVVAVGGLVTAVLAIRRSRPDLEDARDGDTATTAAGGDGSDRPDDGDGTGTTTGPERG